MKSPKYFLFSLLALMAVNSASACWEPKYSVDAYSMYRVDKSKTYESWVSETDNCEAWQRLTSESIPLEDIRYVVYKMSLEAYDSMYVNRSAKYDNKFAEWITKRDTASLDFLYLAKNNEYIRLKHISKWYYPTMKTGANMTLEEIVEKSLASKDARLRDRYLLQAVRAMTTLSRYEDCVALWESEVSKLPEDNLMREMIYPYICGAYLNLDNQARAIEQFAKLGDVGSLEICARSNGAEFPKIYALEMMSQYAPNNKSIAQTLQSIVHRYEPRVLIYDEKTAIKETPEIKQLYALCLKAAKNKECDNAAMWYYTAAFISDLKGDTKSALHNLKLAENSKATNYMAESIKVFRIYIDAKTSTINSAYESKLFGQLQWLDKKIVDNYNTEVAKQATSGYSLDLGSSCDYWDDMMRRILISEVCPRFIKAGKSTRALQLANMADNRLLNLKDKQRREIFEQNAEGEYEYQVKYCTMQQYRYSYSEQFNEYDYSNHFFEMIDSIGLNATIEYVERVERPVSQFDKFLNERGYTGSDYLNDIVGTQCLRNMQYEMAVKYLGKVSKAYQNHQNVYLNCEPFSLKRKWIPTKYDFKYEFAFTMNALAQAMKITTEPNRKAQLMFTYATGLRNSFDYCWVLTQYYRGEVFGNQVCLKRDWEKDEYTKAAIKEAQQLVEDACEIVTDAEVAANMHYVLGHYKTVATKYPNTQMADLVRGQCDNLRDYQILTAEFRPSAKL